MTMQTHDAVQAERAAAMQRIRPQVVTILRRIMAAMPGWSRSDAEAFLVEPSKVFLGLCDRVDPMEAEVVGRELGELFPDVLNELFPEGGRPPLG
jgi:hypothetical protein